MTATKRPLEEDTVADSVETMDTPAKKIKTENHDINDNDTALSVLEDTTEAPAENNETIKREEPQEMPVAEDSKETTPVAGEPQETAPVAEGSQKTTPVADEINDTTAHPSAPTPANEGEEQEETKFRIRVENLPRYCDKKLVTKFCTKYEVFPDNVKKAPNWKGFAFLTFKTREKRDEALEKLNGKTVKDMEVRVSVAQAVERKSVRDMRGKSQRSIAAEDTKDTRPPHERLADQITPFWRIEYAQQLKKKQKLALDAMQKFKEGMHKYITRKYIQRNLGHVALPDPVLMTPAQQTTYQLRWFLPACKENDGIPAPLLDILPSPKVNGYRTKCEFTFGWDLDGKPVAGFLLGLYKDGVIAVLDPSKALNIPSPMAKISKALTEFLQNSDLPIYDRINKTGFWREAVVRYYRSAESMLIVQYNPTGVEDEKIAEARQSLQKFIEQQVADKKIIVTTLLVQSHAGHHNGFLEHEPTELLYGPGYVRETLMGLKFRISPTAFFQVNTEATEVLYDTVREWCSLDLVEEEREKRLTAEASVALPTPPGTILLDLCCGTGTIGLTMASHVKKVIGVDIVEQAVADAKFNAELNEIDNVVYYADRVEKVIKQIINEHVGPLDDVVAVLDPPRAGVHEDVIKTIRKCPRINRVIFVSCDANLASKNFTEPHSNKWEGLPFMPIRAQPVDMFPHTKHFELILEFKRVEVPTNST